MGPDTHCVSTESLKQAELDLIQRSAKRSSQSDRETPADTEMPDPESAGQADVTRVREPAPALWGISLSGGGIRSATFSLGVLQVLARNDLLRCFHYQSTVSGGGYIGAFLQGLIRRQGYERAFAVLKSGIGDGEVASAQGARSAADAQAPIMHLRRYSNYLSPRKAALTGDTLGMAGTYVRNVLIIQLQLCALLLLLSLVPVALYPWVRRVALLWPVWLLLGAGALGMVSALLLGRVTSSANRLRLIRAKDAGTSGAASDGHPSSARAAPESPEAPDSGLLWCAALSIVTLALATALAAAGLWGLNTAAGSVAGGSFIGRPWSVFWSSLDGKIFGATSAGYLVGWLAWMELERGIATLRAMGLKNSRSPTWLTRVCSKLIGVRLVDGAIDAEEDASPLLIHKGRFVLATFVAAAGPVPRAAK